MNRIVEPGNPLASGADMNETLTCLSVQAAILAGGASSRLWPLSRERNPKQLIDPMADESLLEATLRRLDAAFVVAEHSAAAAGTLAPLAMSTPLVVCCEDRRLQTLGRLEQCRRPARMVLEPAARNTAPALTVAALAARASAVDGDDPVIVALPSDHLIVDHGPFGAALAAALNHAARGAIVTFGVPPHRAATGYGYIRTGMALGAQGARAIGRFVEKPDAELAERYVASGGYWWNSGMFVVRASVWLAAIQVCRPVIAAACAQAFERATEDGDGALHLARDPFAACPSDSIDYAVMERIGTDPRLVGVAIPLVAGWSDVGAWDTVWDASTRDAGCNVARGRVVVAGSSGSVAHAEGRLAACAGMTGVVVVETADTVLVAAKDRVQDVKAIVGGLETRHSAEAQEHRKISQPLGCCDSPERGKRFQVKRISAGASRARHER